MSRRSAIPGPRCARRSTCHRCWHRCSTPHQVHTKCCRSQQHNTMCLPAATAWLTTLVRRLAAHPSTRLNPPRFPCISLLCSEVCSLRADVLDVPGPLADDLSDLLMAEGASSTSVEEFRPEGAPEQEIYAHEVAAAAGLELRLWARCTVIAHFPPEVRECLQSASLGLGACWFVPAYAPCASRGCWLMESRHPPTHLQAHTLCATRVPPCTAQPISP